MPSMYAHYRLGFRSLKDLEPEIAACIRQNRLMYDLGLHGPDFFFFYNPVFDNKMTRLGEAVHHMTGRDFFTRAVRLLRFEPNDAATAYLLGVAAHFALDSVCHPFVNERTGKDAGHVEMETELDRALLERDGRPEPHKQDIFSHIRTPGAKDAAYIARFYPPATTGQVLTGFRHMQLIGKIITAPEGPRRSAIGAGALGGTANEMLMMTAANPRCRELTPKLLELWEQARDLYPRLASQLWHHLHGSGRLGEAFDKEFG